MGNAMSLAILGQTVRSPFFWLSQMIDDAEEKLVVQAIRDRNFSRYIGSNVPNLEQTLRLTSANAATVTDYWHFLGGAERSSVCGGIRGKVRCAIRGADQFGDNGSVSRACVLRCWPGR